VITTNISDALPRCIQWRAIPELPMKTRLWLALGVSFFTLIAGAQAQSGKSDKKQKSPAEAAIEPYYKARAEAAKNPGDATFQKLIDAGLTWLGQYPEDPRAPDVIRDLGSFGVNVLTKKDQKPLHAAYTSRLNYEVVAQKYKPDVTPAMKTTFAALECAVADAQARDEFNGANMIASREKIDALAAMPNSSRYLVVAELAFVDLLNKGKSPAAGEKQLRKLAESSDKTLAEVAQQELGLAEMRRQPVEMKLAGLDGKEVDLAQYRGKVLAVAFWSATNDSSRKELESLRELHSDLRKKGFEVVTVSYDTADDKPQLEKAVKDLKLSWPVAFEGNGAENALGKKLTVRRVPAVAVFDQKGLLVATALRGGRVGTEVRKLLGVEEPPADWGTVPPLKKPKR
jgi:peroxiredoxin